MIWDGRYAIDRTLGEGGMGRVVLARDLAASARPVALKVLLPEYRHATSGFLREYVIQRGLHHPNIPRVYDLGFARHPRGEVPYVSMQLCRGVPLILAMRRMTSLEQAWPWMAQLLRALDYLHGQGWLHRDLKPGNLLVDLDDRSESSARLIDFGVATRIGDPPEAVFIGTPEYCSPELLAGEPYDERSDLYAFGLMLYEVIEGRRPWPGSDEQQLLDDRVLVRMPRIEHPGCPPMLSRLIEELLAPEVEDRPATAGEVLDRFAEAVGDTMPLETPLAFAHRLHGVPVPGRDEVERAGQHVLDGVVPGTSDTSSGTSVLLIEGAEGLGADRLAAELGDRAAVHGRRVLRIRIGTGPLGSLDALGPALDTLGRLRRLPFEQDDEAAPARPDLAGAAAWLTRLHGPTTLVIEHLHRADRDSLEVLRAVFKGSRAPQLTVIGTWSAAETPRDPQAWSAFVECPCILAQHVAPLSPEHTAQWIEAAVGRGVVPVTAVTRLHSQAKGNPAALVQGVREWFHEGLIVRTTVGYRSADRAWPGAAPKTEDPRLDWRIACLEHALPEDVVRAYLDEFSPHLPRLIADGLLAAKGAESLAVVDDAWRETAYARMPAAEKMRNHRRLARAIHGADIFPNQRSLVAIELMRSDRPVLAVPHLVVAAAQGVTYGTSAQAVDYLDRAADLLEHHLSASSGVGEDEAWRWRVMLCKARVRCARIQDDLGALELAATQLAELGAEMAHVPTLRTALEVRLELDHARYDFQALVRHAASRRQLDGASPSPESLALWEWAQAEREAAEGALDEALAHVERGLAVRSASGEPPRAEVLMRLARIQARLATEHEWSRDGMAAVAQYERLAKAADDPRAAADAGVLQVQLFRQAGRPEAALQRVRRLAKELSHQLPPRFASAVEREMAWSHLAFGWVDTALEHIHQARALRDSCGAAPDQDAALAELTVLRAHALLASGRRAEARGTVSRALSTKLPYWARGPRRALEEVALALAVPRARPTAAAMLIGDAEQLAERCELEQAWAARARVLGLAAEAALRAEHPKQAVALAERALLAQESSRGSVENLPRLLSVLGRCRSATHRAHGAQALQLRAMEELRRSAAQILDPTHRQAWLAAQSRHGVLASAAAAA